MFCDETREMMVEMPEAVRRSMAARRALEKKRNLLH
jgi:hypothetical protein